MNRCIFFFIIFPVTGTNEKKKIMKKKIFFVLQNGFGLLPICIAGEWKLYCNTVGWKAVGIVLQYN